jgi:hypothetical protein
MADRQDAIRVLRDRTGLNPTEAANVLSALLAAVQQEVLDLVAGDQPVPSALADARALRLRYVAEKLNRPLTQREVEALFRLTPSAAATVIGRMNATYATLAERLLRASVLAAVGDPQNLRLEGSDDAGWRYVIAFDERAQVEYAAAVFERNGHGRAVLRKSARSLEVEQRIANRDSVDQLEQWLS